MFLLDDFVMTAEQPSNLKFVIRWENLFHKLSLYASASPQRAVFALFKSFSQ